MKLPESKLIKNQKKEITVDFVENGKPYKLVIKLRYDDECNNGHNTFSITANRYGQNGSWAFGCLHEDIEKYASHLEKYIKWHLTTSNGPLYYVENALYHARDTDYDGLRAGEYGCYKIKVLCNLHEDSDIIMCVYTTSVCYVNALNNPNLTKVNVREQEKLDKFLKGLNPDLNPRMEKVFLKYSLSKGKPLDLQAARNTAVWPEAELEDFTKEKLLARLPSLMLEFQADMLELGFEY